MAQAGVTVLQSSQQSNYEPHHVVVLRAKGTEFLVAAGDRGWLLPWVDIGSDERLAQSLTQAVRRDWGCQAICLFSPVVPSSAIRANEIRYEVMECCCHKTHDCRTKWVPVAALSLNCFSDADDYAVVQQSVAEGHVHSCAQAPGPFAKIGWLGELQMWIEERVAPLGLRLTGEFCQWNASPCFSLIRFETNGPALWFKAVGEPNLREFPITSTLAELFPSFVPPLLATRPAWHGWVSREVEGTNLGETRDLQCWQDAASSLAQMQIQSLGRRPQLRRSGARDLRTSGLANLVDPFVDVVDRLMGQQVKVPPALLSAKQLLRLGEQIRDALSRLSGLGIPDSLGHLDLNPWNIVVGREGCAFLDWAEAYVGHPFYSFQYLLEHFRRAVSLDRSRESHLTESYAEPWRHVVCGDAVGEALKLARMLAVFAYAAGTEVWNDGENLRDPATAAFLRSLARRLNREAIEIDQIDSLD
jgi:hypothetical protein